MPFYGNLYGATEVCKDSAEYAMQYGAAFVAHGLPSAVGALQSGVKSLDKVVETIADDKVKVALRKQLYDQAWLKDHPPPYMVAITEASNTLRAQLIQMIDDQGEVKKRVILIEVDAKIKTAVDRLKTEFKDFFAQNVRDSLPTVARRLGQLEVEVGGSPGGPGGINKALVDLTRRVRIIEQSAPNRQTKDTSAASRCCHHCAEIKVVKADLNVLLQRLWEPKKGEINLQRMWEFCNWAGPQMEKKFREYDAKLEALDGMTAPAEQPRDNPCGCDENVINTLTASVEGHDQRIVHIESMFPQLTAMWDFCEALKNEGLPNFQNHMDTELQKLDKRISAHEAKVNSESVQSLVDAAVKQALKDSEATFDGKVKSIEESVKGQVKAAVAKAKANFDKDINKRIEDSVKGQVKTAVADVVAKKEEEIQGLKADNKQLKNEKATLEGKLEAKDRELEKQGEKIKDQEKKIDEQGKKIEAHDRIFEALAIEQREQNDRLARLEQRQQTSGGQNPPGLPDQQQPPQSPRDAQSPSQAPPAPQGNGPFTPSPSPPHQGSQDNQGCQDKQCTPGNPMDVQDVSVDGAQSEADLLDFDTGDHEMEEAPKNTAQPEQPQAQPAPIFGTQPTGQPEQPLFGQGPTEPQPPAAGPTPSIFGNVGQASGSDPSINWGAKLGDINFANLDQPPPAPASPEHDMTPAGSAPFTPWGTGSVPSFFPQTPSASGPGAPAPVAPMFARDAPSQSNAFPSAAPAGAFDFSAPLAPVRANPIVPASEMGAAFENMTFGNGQLKGIPKAGQQVNAQGLPIIQPRKRQPNTTQPQTSNPGVLPAAQPVRNLNAYVEDAPDEEQDVHMDMGGQGAGQNANPVAPAAHEASMDSEPTPVPVQPSNSDHMQSLQPGVSNTKFSLDVFDKWKADLCSKHTTFAKVSRTLSVDHERGQRQNQVWQDNLDMIERTKGNTDKLLYDLGLLQAKANGFSKDEMTRLMRAWLEKVFLEAGIETSRKDQAKLEKSTKPATPEATTHNEPAPILTQPSTSRAVAETGFQQPQQPAQQTVQNTRYSLAVYDRWRGNMWAQNQDFATLAGITGASDSKKQQLNNDWPARLAALDDKADLITPALLRSHLKLDPNLKGYTRFDMDRLMSLWIRKVFIVAMADLSGKGQGAHASVCSALLNKSKAEWLTPENADVA